MILLSSEKHFCCNYYSFIYCYCSNFCCCTSHWRCSNRYVATWPHWQVVALCSWPVRSSDRSFVHLLPKLWTQYFENERTNFDAKWHK